MARTLPFDEIEEGLWLGPCPHTPELIARLRSDCGVTGLLSVQTDQDLNSMGLSWPLMWRFLMHQGISATRCPIVDFDDRSLLSRLDDAVDALDDLRSAGQTTYVHCTAGLNRSPTVTIAWLADRREMGLDAAWTLVTSRRRCAPHRKLLETWLARRLPA